MSKAIGVLLLVVALGFFITQIIQEVFLEYNWDKSVMCWWSLADKASTIQGKEENIDKFVEALQKNIDLDDYNAVFLRTPNNSAKYNFQAVQTLQKRLQEIKTMKVDSFEYQSAIQQITAQEQGEAKQMLGVFEGLYTRHNFPMVWDWWGGLIMLLWIVLGAVGIVCLMYD